MSKKSIIIICSVIILLLTVSGLGVWSYHKQSEYESRLADLSNSNSKLKEQLTKADYQLESLLERNERAVELTRSAGSIVRELGESMESTADTIKEIRYQQQRIRTAVVQLISNYEELARELDGNTD